MADDASIRAASVAVYLPGATASRALSGSVITNDPAALTLQVTLSGIPANTRLVVYPAVNSRLQPAVTFQTGAVDPVVPVQVGLGLSMVAAAVDTPDLPRISTFAAISPSSAVYELPAPINGVTVSGLGSIDIARLEASGFRFGFIDGTSAVNLVDGSITVGSTTRQAGLQRLYLGLLGRTGDATGLGQYDGQLSRGSSLAQVADQILAGAEYATGHGRPTDTQYASSLYDAFRSTVPTRPAWQRSRRGSPPEKAGARSPRNSPRDPRRWPDMPIAPPPSSSATRMRRR